LGLCAPEAYFLSKDVQAVLMSSRDKFKNCPDVLLVDKMGELLQMYAICNVAFIGGSMVGQGGHNPLEPAVFSKPILFGEDMSDFLLISTWLLDQGGANLVRSEQDLEKNLETLLDNRDLQRQMGKRNFEVFSNNSGAVKKIIKNMERLHIV